jgi:hypothetical protein
LARYQRRRLLQSVGGTANRRGKVIAWTESKKERERERERERESRWEGAVGYINLGRAGLKILSIDGERAANGVQLIPIW